MTDSSTEMLTANIYKMMMIASATVVPLLANITSEAMTIYDKWGATGLFIAMAAIFYNLWRRDMTALMKEKDKQLVEKNDRIKDLQEALRVNRERLTEEMNRRNQ